MVNEMDENMNMNANTYDANLPDPGKEVPLEITSITDLEKVKNGAIVRFSDFTEGQPFVARVRRPSLMEMAKNGRIPNELMKAATQLFAKGAQAFVDNKNSRAMAEMYELCRVIAGSVLMEPKLADLDAAGIQLTDQHLIEIFTYTQAGTKALESFRTE